MSEQTYGTLLDEEGTARRVAGDQPFMVKPGCVGYVQSGRLDLFAVRVDAGSPVGRRTHILRLEAGDPLVGTGMEPQSGIGMIAVGNSGTVLVEVQDRYLAAIFARPSSWRAAAEFFAAWVEPVCGVTASGRSPRTGVYVQQEAPLTVNGGSCVRPGVEFGWMRQLRGTSRFLDRTGCELIEGELLPIASPAWLQTVEHGELRLSATEMLLADAQSSGTEELWTAVGRLNRMLLTITQQRLKEHADTHVQRSRLRRVAANAAFSSALVRLAAPMLPARQGEPAAFRSAVEEDDLLAGFRVVLDAAGIRAPLPHRTSLEGSRDRLAAVTQMLRLRSRRVALRHEWWKSDCGPLLARSSESRRYVALVFNGRHGYRLINPADGTRRIVDAATAARLEPFAHTFYEPFPESPLSLRAVLRFGMSGLRDDLLTVLGVSLLVGWLGMLTPMAIGLLFGGVIPSADRAQLLQLSIILLLSGLISAVFSVVRGLALLRVQIKAGAKIQAAIWDRLVALPLRFFRDYSAGDLAVRAMNMEQIRQTLSLAVLSPLLNGVFSLFSFALLVYYDPALSVAAGTLLLIALGTSFGVSYLQRRRQRTILTLQSKTSGLVLQLLNGITKLKVAGGESRAFGLWADLFGRQRQEQYRLRMLGNVLGVFNACFPLLSTLTIFGLQATYRPDLTTGDFLGFIAAFNLCLAAVTSGGAAVVSVLSVGPLYEQVQPILMARPEVDSVTRAAGTLTGHVELQHVSFRYHADSPTVIRDLSIRIHPGEFVAFVGPSGSGKSTLLRLILGFETPESGSIYYDEQELSGLDIRSVRRQIGVVLQTGRVMPGDIFTNIVGSSLATLDDAWRAARMAGLEDDISAMPMGMHTMVDETGSTLSGGQRQRLLIARALVNKPRLLLFDEATSALDNRTQEIVSRSLDQLHATRIVVAHRLSTIQHADRIYVIRAGELAEVGDHDELMAQKGLFYRMAQRQIA